MKALRFVAAVGILAGLVLAAALAPGASANGVPQLVKLTYLPGVSNWGPQDAEGVLEFSFAEAYLRVDVKNLPPQKGYEYEGWMVAPDGATFFVGTITTDGSGLGTYEGQLKGLERYDYDLFVVAARGEDTTPGAMPGRKSIAGRFTVIDDTNPGTSRPDTLPDTGQAPAGDARFGTLSVAAGAVALGGLAIVVGAHILRRRDA